ncbi:MAG: CPBP family glutamic-type intramembrane protease [Terriglobia bacterium]
MASTQPPTPKLLAPAGRRWTRAATALELLLVYACILLYIWRWQSRHPFLWIPLLAFIIFTHVLHGDTPRALGLTFHEIRGNAAIILPLAAVIYGGVVVYALSTHRLQLIWPGRATWERFVGYGIWCCFQQYLAQSYFHRRLMEVVRTPHLAPVLVGLMFGGAHIPNRVLVVVTIVGGIILAEVFARHPNIWPLALAQAVGGLLIAALVPAAIIHNMRVGPGYYTYRPPGR